MEIQRIQEVLEASPQLEGCTVNVSGDGYQHEILVVGAVFETLNKVKRQQLIYSILNEYIVSGELHAINMKTLTPSEFSQ
jgi:acid stress-induced BolA-like protein IbaG/YrbA